MDVFINYLLNSFYFLLIIILVFYIPGNLFINRLKLPFVQNLSSSILLGVSMWALQGFIFGHLNLRPITYLYLFITTLIWIKINYKNKNIKINLKIKKVNKKDLLIPFVIILGIIFQITTILANAIPVREGLFFCCGGSDALYHAALVNELIKNFPPNEPGIANISLNNYHYLSNLINSEIIRIFKIPLIQLEFHFMPIFLSIMFGLSAYSVAQILKIGKTFTIFFLILIFFFADFLYIFLIFTTKSLNFNLTTIETSLSLWISYTRYMGIILFFQSILFLYLWIKNEKIKYFIPLLITGGALIGFKVYVGLIFLAGISGLILFYIYKKELKKISLLILLILFSILIYLPGNSGAGGLIFTGFWRTRDFAANEQTGISNLELARRIFESNNNIKKYFFDLIFFIIYIIFSFGILLTGLLNPLKELKKIPIELHVFFFTALISTFGIGMFFIQKTGGSNTSQFLISGFLILSFYTALFFNYLYNHKNKYLKFIPFLLIILMIPKLGSTIYKNSQVIQDYKNYSVSNDLLNALDFINSNSDINIIALDSKLNDKCLLIPIYTNINPFLCNFGSPQDRGVDLNIKNEINNKLILGNEKIKNNQIKYVLLHKSSPNGRFHNMIYENNNYKILIYDK